MKAPKHVVSLSGGKDSTAMLLRLLEENRPVDLILYCDTGLEFPQMYDHLNRLEDYIDREITWLKAPYNFEYYFFEHHPKRKNPVLDQYDGMSWPGPNNRWCTGMLKIHPISTYLKMLEKNYEVIEYIGIAADEIHRIKDKSYPLVEWGMTEHDCLTYCYKRGFDWGGLYELYDRVSCWCCPLQVLNGLRNLYEHFPNLWQRLQAWDKATWRQFRNDYSVQELARRFEFEKEWEARGGKLHTRTFFSALKDELAQHKQEAAGAA
jgi:3'-phosphoadenosine 5'-phosphosulfate sulfotransferase (PAPS reductase)/FAD synthetase